MKTKNKYKEYCVGCGLCKSEFNCKKYKENGFIYYDNSCVDNEFFENVCPYSGKSLNYSEDSIWGNLKNIYYGWSAKDNIRYRASSGGVLTSLAIFLIEQKYVDGIIQIKANEQEPLKTNVVCNTTKEEIISCMGSRYSNSSVLEDLNKLIDKEKKYALIGRPCDILTLKNYQNEYNLYKNIIYTLSFFCAGNPSDLANEKMLYDMGIENLERFTKINYRGNRLARLYPS